MGRRLATAGVVALAFALGLAWSLAPRESEPPPAGVDVAAARPQTEATSPAALPGLPASLTGTEIDGGFALDADGRFVLTRDTLDLFDYFLAASGEEPTETIRRRIEREIERGLSEQDRAAALDLLDRYLAYRDALHRMAETEGLATLSLDRRFQRLRELRREFFDAAEREAFFADEEERWRVDLARLRALQSPDLDETERAERLRALEHTLPEEVRAAQDAATAATLLRRDEAALREAGASEAEIHGLREARFGPEAAVRLAALDRRRDAWNRRLDHWYEERDALRARGASDPELAALRAERFQASELRRVEALERLHDAEGSGSP